MRITIVLNHGGKRQLYHEKSIIGILVRREREWAKDRGRGGKNMKRTTKQ